MGYTKIDNCWLDSPNQLKNAEFRIMMVLERLLTGYHRKSYKIAYSQLSKMTGIKNIYVIMKSLRQKGLVNFESESGRASNIRINKPTKLVSRLPYKSVSTPIEVIDTHHINNLHDPPLAKESIKENLKKDNFLIEFKNQYPAEKIDDDLDEVWKSISINDKHIAVGVMEFQNNKWNDPNFNRKFIPKASNFILKQLYLEDGVKKPYDAEIRRKQKVKEHREYLKEADKNSATDEERKEILSNWKNQSFIAEKG